MLLFSALVGICFIEIHCQCLEYDLIAYGIWELGKLFIMVSAKANTAGTCNARGQCNLCFLYNMVYNLVMWRKFCLSVNLVTGRLVFRGSMLLTSSGARRPANIDHEFMCFNPMISFMGVPLFLAAKLT